MNYGGEAGLRISKQAIIYQVLLDAESCFSFLFATATYKTTFQYKNSWAKIIGIALPGKRGYDTCLRA